MEMMIALFFALLIIGVVFGLIIGGTVLWVVMLIDTAKRHDWHDDNEQVIWIVLQVAIGLIGSIAYYFAIYKSRGKAIDQPVK
jgi:heme/copper-type cytochrome/quinol oxidase subunit 2